MTNRNRGIDLLRIISIIMITAYHVIVPGMGQYAFYNGTLPIKILYAICACGVNCFILISGYVNINSDYKISRIVKILLEALFYNIALTIIISLLNNTLSISRIINSLNILSNEGWWFIKPYIILFIMIPLLNKAVHNLDKKYLTYSILLLLFFTSLYCVLMGDVFYTGDGYSSLWFIIVYLIGAYIKKYEDSINIRKVALIIVFITNIIITVSSFYILYNYNGAHLDSYIAENKLFIYTSPTIVINSIVLLLLFKEIKLSNTISKTISWITPSVFSVYLIQCQHYVYSFYFPDYFIFLNKYNYRLMLYIPLVAILMVFIMIIIDQIRIILSKIFKTKIIYSYIDSWFNNLK